MEQIPKTIPKFKSFGDMLRYLKVMVVALKGPLEREGYEVKVIRTKFQGKEWDAILMRETKHDHDGHLDLG